MQILRAKPTDDQLIVPLFVQYREFYKREAKVEQATEFLRERLANNESVIFYALEDNVLGFIQLFPSFSSLAMTRLWILNDLFVVPSARRKSVARRLFEKAAEFSRETGARGLTLKTARDNLPAQALYEVMGWKRDERFYS